VLQGKAFWWDVYGRELAKMGASQRARKSEIEKLKSLTHDQLEGFLQMRFGKSALRPRSDLDRAFTPGELKDFARSPWVHLGNHTCDHAILTNCCAQEMARQVQGCQEVLRQLAGYAPIAIAYPNGNYSQAVVEVSLAAGLRVGLTVLPHRDTLPITAAGRMTLGRFSFDGGEGARAQCRKFGAAFVPSNVVKTLINSPHRGARAAAR
jgi:peptidoglycan/xylan/chitin deacetylase (PgdA/CDA1 family)